MSAPEELVRELHDIRRCLWLERTARASWRGLVLGVATLVLVELLIRLTHTPATISGAAAIVPGLAVLALVGWCAVRRPTLGQAARLADRRLGLRAQVATSLELIGAQTSPFGAAQVARAATAVRRARQRSPEPVRHWTATLLACFFMAVGVGGVTWLAEDWLRSIQLPAFPAATIDNVATEDTPQSGGGGQTLPDGLQQILQEVDGEDAPSLQQLASAEQALGDKTAQSRATQQALSNLAGALQQTSAGQAAADALNSGDYQTAAADIAQLGQNSDQLSLDARRTLSKSLEGAALSPSALSDREQRAGQSLRFQSYAPTQQALQNLADSVNKASQSVVSQDQLSAAWQQLDAARRRAQAQGSQPPAGSQSLQATSDSGPSQLAAGGPPGQTDQAAGGRGNTSSGFQPGDRSQLSALGVSVDVPLQVSAGPGRQAQPGADQPRVVQVVSDPAPLSDTGSPAATVQSAPAERNSVPADLRPVVREYFSNGG